MLRYHRDGCHCSGERTLSTGGWNRHQRSLHRCFEECGSQSGAALAVELARNHGGTAFAPMEHALRGFGMVMSEEQARRLSRHPLVELVEEDEWLRTSNERQGFDFRAESEALRLAKSTAVDSCPWNGSFYQCSYADATFWGLDRLDQLVRMHRCIGREVLDEPRLRSGPCEVRNTPQGIVPR